MPQREAFFRWVRRGVIVEHNGAALPDDIAPKTGLRNDKLHRFLKNGAFGHRVF
ncbi:hypothetical protein U14_00253 [Candidatus Moduliflexus flocculans]|uniref:Uncharacterized protein n=1 Tax=Candidatus Moduliflexus flocculans TaxID=1499966 RepID=A0A0S6VPQ3_9BACT|nr:hypothetical protein U14_00253 [Candidatus Moduliflexus flocculans]